MPLFDFPELALTQISLLVISGVWMLRRNDEIPLLISTFIFYFSSYRYWVVTNGWSEWVNITNFGFDPITNESALAALPYMVFGQVCLLTTYMLLQKKNIGLLVVNSDREQRDFVKTSAIAKTTFKYSNLLIHHLGE